MTQVSEEVQLVNQRGLHARASAKFVTLVGNMPDGVSVDVEKDGTKVTGTSIMGLMMLGAGKDSHVTIHVTADDSAQAEQVLAKLAGLVKDGFGED